MTTTAAPNKSVTGESAAEFVAALQRADLPLDIRSRAAWTLRDTIGCALGGSATRAAQTAARLLEGETGEFRALWPEAPLAPAADAAFLSSVSASALDFDDGHYLGGAIHPASVIVPSLLVGASQVGASLEDLLVAQVAAYEIAVRAAHLLWPRHPTDHYHCTGTAAAIGAAAGVARLRGGDADVIWRAMQIAWGHAPMAGLQLPMAKEAIGWSAATALTAALLAENGFMTYADRPERPPAPVGFDRTPFDADGAADDPFVTTLGETFETGRNYLKPYASCRFTHAAAVALKELIDDGLVPDDIQSVKVSTHACAGFLTTPRPSSLEHAQYSYPFVLGSIAVYGDAGPDQINEDRLGDEAVLDFGSRVSVTYDPALDVHYPGHYPASVAVTTRTGQTVERTVVELPGDFERPMSPEELENKFIRLAGPIVGEANAHELSRLCACETGSVSDLFELLRSS